MPNRKWIAAVLVATALGLGGCADSAEEDSGGDPAATLEAVEGSDVSRVTLSELGATRLDIATAAVRQAPDGKGLIIPFAAVIYDADGVAWTFTNPSGRTYLRERIEIASIDGDNAVLSSGPAAGTAVVTVGAIELVGAEEELGA